MKISPRDLSLVTGFCLNIVTRGEVGGEAAGSSGP